MHLEALWKETTGFFFPVWCAGCGEEGIELCEHCRQQPSYPHTPTIAWRQALAGIPVRAATHYDEHWRRVILSWKEQGQFRLATPLGMLLHPLVQEVAGGRRVVLVPVPSSFSGWLKRGVEPSVLLARAVVSQSEQPGWSVQRVLGRSGFAGSAQKTKRRRDRLRTSRNFRVRRALPREPIVLVDDIVTTGGTLESAARVLVNAGYGVIGAAVLAATPGVTGANDQDYAEGTSR